MIQEINVRFYIFLIRQIQRTTTEASPFTYHSRGVSMIVFCYNKRMVTKSIVIYGHRIYVTISLVMRVPNLCFGSPKYLF